MAEGTHVFVTGRRQAGFVRKAPAIGPNVVAVRADSSNLADLDRRYDLIRTERGHIDILFANAGGGEFAALSDITEVHYDKILRYQRKRVFCSRCRQRFRCFEKAVRSS